MPTKKQLNGMIRGLSKRLYCLEHPGQEWEKPTGGIVTNACGFPPRERWLEIWSREKNSVTPFLRFRESKKPTLLEKALAACAAKVEEDLSTVEHERDRLLEKLSTAEHQRDQLQEELEDPDPQRMEGRSICFPTAGENGVTLILANEDQACPTIKSLRRFLRKYPPIEAHGGEWQIWTNSRGEIIDYLRGKTSGIDHLRGKASGTRP